MTPKRLKYPLARVLGTTAFASLAMLAACEAKLPTSQDVEDMTALSAVQRVSVTGMIDTANVTYYVNNMKASKAEVDKIAAERIATVNITGKGMQSGGAVYLTLRDPVVIGDSSAPTLVSFRTGRDSVILRANPDQLRQLTSAMTRADSAGPNAKQVAESKPRTGFTGIVIIDGAVSDMTTMSRIAPDRIATVDVLKGDAARAQYPNDPRAANGVIRITTKR